MAVIDASVWVSLHNPQDRFHEEAKSIIDDLYSTKAALSVPTLAFTEVAGVIKRLTGDVKAAEETVLNMKEMDLEVWDVDSQEIEPLATKIAAHYGVRGADACYIAVARLTSSTLYTFDKRQKTAFEEMTKSFE